jgi:hypothetical protein
MLGSGYSDAVLKVSNEVVCDELAAIHDTPSHRGGIDHRDWGEWRLHLRLC